MSENQQQPKYEFYLICTPGFEDVVERELRLWFPALEARRERGGIAVSTSSLTEGFAMNRVLKTPTRVLLRLVSFGCRDFPKLFKKVSGYPWEEWLSDQSRIVFHATSSGSRVKIKTRIEETCWEARVMRLKKRGRPHARFEGPPADVHIRLKDDVCHLSLDTSGEILHKRGTRRLSSHAPLRETTAAALLHLLRNLSSEPEAPVEILDPMMGGGTFLLEAEGLLRPVVTRPFAFESFTVDAETRWLPASPVGGRLADRLLGFDIDPGAVAAARGNLRAVERREGLELREVDFFAVEKLPAVAHRWVLCNPPYDERIGVSEKLPDFYRRLLEQIERVAQPEMAAFIFPRSACPEELRAPTKWRLLETRPFSNGGIDVAALVYRRLS